MPSQPYYVDVEKRRRKTRLIAVIGDMVESRALSPSARAVAQAEFAGLVRKLNTRFKRAVASQFVVTIGDEFQGLLRTAEVIPELIWTIESSYAARDIRIGIGYGVLHTPLRKTALNIDGPVLHEARAAIMIARDKRMLGGVFHGFGSFDSILLGLAQLTRHIRSNWTDRQREVVGLLRENLTQTEIAERLGVSKQAVSDHSVAAGWEPYRLAEAGWLQALALARAGQARTR